jgi:hypothetical protein
MAEQERSGGRRAIKVSKPYDHSVGNQITAASQFHAEAGDPAARDLLRRMYEQAPGITGSDIVRTHD